MELSGVSVNTTIPTAKLTTPHEEFPNTLHVATTTRLARYSIVIAQHAEYQSVAGFDRKIIIL